jgi:hypothetical protein
VRQVNGIARLLLAAHASNRERRPEGRVAAIIARASENFGDKKERARSSRARSSL